jgi:hypothetical protein
MKPINEYTLQDCLNSILKADMILHRHELANRIRELTRWIPVEERLPTEEDADQHGYILIREVENESPKRVYPALVKWKYIGKPNYFYTVTDWKRIDP